MSKKVLVFVEDPGAANGVLDLARTLEARHGIQTEIRAAGAAVAFLEANLRSGTFAVAERSADALLERVCPGAVLVGTSENPETLGLALVDAARVRNIPSLGFVDAFPNASFRWRGLSSDPLAHCPDVVLVPDAWTRDAFVALGLAPSRIVVTGHPHYDAVLEKRRSLEAEGRTAVRARVFPSAPENTRVVTFASELSTGFDAAQFQRSAAYSLHGRGQRHGRTEIVLEELVDALRAGPPVHVVLRLHPKNTVEELDGLVSEVDTLSRGGSPLDVAFASDLVCGMTSTFLVEAALLGRRTLAIVPRELESEWLPTVRAGITPCVWTREALRAQLAASLASADESVPPFVSPGAGARIGAVIRAALEGRSTR